MEELEFRKYEGFCEHCGYIYTPMFYLSKDGADWCLDCANTESWIDVETWREYYRKIENEINNDK